MVISKRVGKVTEHHRPAFLLGRVITAGVATISGGLTQAAPDFPKKLAHIIGLRQKLGEAIPYLGDRGNKPPWIEHILGNRGDNTTKSSISVD